MRLEPLDKTQIENIVSKAIQDAIDFCDGEIEPQRLKAQRYYDLGCDLGSEDGRSSVVSAKCREVVRGIKPSLQRVFLASEKPVEFVPRGAEDVQAAEQATQFINYKFQQHNGYKLINDVFQDALVKKTGIAYIYYNEMMEQETHTLTGLSDDEFTLLVTDDDVEVLEHEIKTSMSMDEQGMEIEMPVHDVKLIRNIPNGDICIESVPPEDFFVDRNARSIEDFYICGHTAEVRVADILAMGFSLDDLSGVDATEYSVADDEAEFERRGYTVDDSEDENISAASKKITLTTAYMELDIEGSGVPQLYQFLCVGANHTLLNFYSADHAPYAIFEVDGEPHAFFGTSLVDLTITDQDAATSMLRGILDNAALTNNPAVQILDGQVQVEDLLNNEIGRIVRVKSPNAVQEMAVPFTAAQTLPALQYFDQSVDNKTGVSKMAQGLNPDVLKSATATSIAASMEGQSGQAEVIARNLAEGGMKRLFKLMLDLYVKNTDKEEVMRLNGQFVPVDPRAWSADMDLSVNVGLGTGRENERAAALQLAFGIQQQLYQTYGAANGIVTLTQIRNTLADILALGGIRNIDRHFMPMSPEIEQQMMAQAQQQQQMMAQMAQQQDPTQAIMQAEAMKTQTQAQMDMAKMQMDNNYKMHELGMKDDLERDKMVQDLAVKVAELLGKYGTAVDVEQIKMEQAAERQHNEAMKNMAMGGGNGSAGY
tara:strand:+ start:2058 stop:4187 length:2130 start_codon:yes stop_codon:yes gene_type:complete